MSPLVRIGLIGLLKSIEALCPPPPCNPGPAPCWEGPQNRSLLLLRLDKSGSYFFFCYSNVMPAGQDALVVVHKLRLQEKGGRWSKNVHFLSTFIR